MYGNCTILDSTNKQSVISMLKKYNLEEEQIEYTLYNNVQLQLSSTTFEPYSLLINNHCNSQ